MSTEYVTLCATVVALTGLTIWLSVRWSATRTERDDARSERDQALTELDAARTCRDATRRERDAASSALEALRTVHKLDKDETWEQRVVGLTQQVDDAVTLAHAEVLRRVEAEQKPAVCDYLESAARGVHAARLVLDADAEPDG